MLGGPKGPGQEASVENIVHPDAFPGALTPGADVLGRTAWSSSWSSGETGTCIAADRNLPFSRPDGTLSHPRCRPYQTSPPPYPHKRPFQKVPSACLEVSHLPGQDAPLLQNPQLIVLRTKLFDGFIVPKFTAGPNNFRAGRECRAGRLRKQMAQDQGRRL